MQLAERGLSTKRMWKDDDVTTASLIIAPSSNHWALVAVDIPRKEIIFLDPLYAANTFMLTKVHAFMLTNKLGPSKFSIMSPPHTMQTDSMNCECFVAGMVNSCA